MNSIRAKVVCVLRNAGRFLLMRITDPHDGRQMLIPPGGGVEFGERLDEAVVREVFEEVGIRIAPPRRLGMLENVFSFAGKPEHELIFVYEAPCPDERLCAQAEITITESNGNLFVGTWLTLDEVAATGLQLVPDGLFELLSVSPERESERGLAKQSNAGQELIGPSSVDTDEAAFLRAITDSRHDVEVIRSYADWLTRHDNEGGEYLRMELERRAMQLRLLELEERMVQFGIFNPIDPDWLDQVYPLHVVSPDIGIFYTSPNPDAEPYVKVGDLCRAETVVGIVEKMKVFLEIQAGTSGVVGEIYVRNGEAVDYGKRLMRLSRPPHLIAGG